VDRVTLTAKVVLGAKQSAAGDSVL
jgi:hypothetical protein